MMITFYFIYNYRSIIVLYLICTYPSNLEANQNPLIRFRIEKIECDFIRIITFLIIFLYIYITKKSEILMIESIETNLNFK